MKFKKKPVIIEAMQFTEDTKNRCFNFVTCNRSAAYKDGEAVLLIQTLEGVMTASLGDWIIKGVNGEYYPCKPDIFEKTYEPAGNNSQSGVERIAAERKRQIGKEGWTPEHDDEHTNGELSQAAACYALQSKFASSLWPFRWDLCYYKPTPGDRIRELEKAGALIAAEIDRLQRKKEKENTSCPASEPGT